MTQTNHDSILKRYNVRISGNGSQTILFAHGFGCDQSMWRFVAPEFENSYRVVTFDLMGSGGSDVGLYSNAKYNSLSSYAHDIVEISQALEIRDGIFVGHSVSAVIGALVSNLQPELFSRLVMVGPSARYINDVNYVGGFERSDIDELLESLSSNYLGWSSVMAPVIMGNADRPELGDELTNSFCRMNPEIAENFAKITFLSDNRADLKKLKAKTLILQCAEDRIAPREVGEYVHNQVAGSQIVYLKATGHCPNLSAPVETVSAIREFLD